MINIFDCFQWDKSIICTSAWHTAQSWQHSMDSTSLTLYSMLHHLCFFFPPATPSQHLAQGMLASLHVSCIHPQLHKVRHKARSYDEASLVALSNALNLLPSTCTSFLYSMHQISESMVIRIYVRSSQLRDHLHDSTKR